MNFDTQDEMLIPWVHRPSSKECYKCTNLGHNQAIILGIWGRQVYLMILVSLVRQEAVM